MKVSAIVNCRYEGGLLRPALESALRSIHASGFGCDCEVIVVADRPNNSTLAILDAYGDRVTATLRTDYGDLGAARNEGVAAARGELVLFLDGDDLWSRNWVGAAWAVHLDAPERTILHPQFAQFFGKEPKILVHTDWRDPFFDPRALVARNFWISLCGVRRQALKEFPYPKVQTEPGLGIEDWSWYAEMIGRGFRHVVAPNTVHFIRQKTANSLVEAVKGFDRLPSLAFAEYMAADDASRPYDL
ncbi:glycosyltransferase [Rhodoblastus acidophilus]|uniref:Glycosyltransferase n=1 Tax=Rhodoblastus acidophilus TaxID=1074 RepID=A0A6N8DM19_RHOAC|nr:glycosyltransferase family 2 protein [Rhodoblastus acidophilus]MCW2274667.1 glycosyltransferase involved in cell wall biosynthesis [Rhodoblastus acidophilus]MTV31622.1 glycosyltransferase [Rhodoblastus acidophilus]